MSLLSKKSHKASKGDCPLSASPFNSRKTLFGFPLNYAIIRAFHSLSPYSSFFLFYAMNTSDKWQTACLLALSGGLQDAYSFFLRGHVFANAQTGNVVLLSRDLVSLNAPSAIRYLIPLCAFAFGILMAEIIRTQGSKRLPCVHWQQLVLWTEAILLFLVGFLPASQNHIANALISFSCAMQVQSFRTLNHKSYASTMCIGNLRSFVEHLFLAAHSHSKTDLLHALSLLAIITLFALGATFGFLLSKPLNLYSIWTSSALLLLASASIPSQKH